MRAGALSNLSSAVVPAPDSDADKSRGPSRPQEAGLGSIHWKESMERRMDIRSRCVDPHCPGILRRATARLEVRSQEEDHGPLGPGFLSCSQGSTSPSPSIARARIQ